MIRFLQTVYSSVSVSVFSINSFHILTNSAVFIFCDPLPIETSIFFVPRRRDSERIIQSSPFPRPRSTSYIGYKCMYTSSKVTKKIEIVSHVEIHEGAHSNSDIVVCSPTRRMIFCNRDLRCILRMFERVKSDILSKKIAMTTSSVSGKNT